MRVLFVGMGGQFTRIVLERVLERGGRTGGEVCALLLSGPELRPLLPEATAPDDPLALPLVDSFVEQSALHVAWAHGIPVYESGPLNSPRLLDILSELAPDVACVACFDRILPGRLLALPRHGFLNVHPSILPDFRGPEPLFWQFRAGVNPVGVTVHWMDRGLDTGDIAGQRTVALADGVSGPAAEARCAAAGGDLLVEVLGKLAAGRATRHPQPSGGSYQPGPAADDFRLDLSWDARRAFNFMRGTAGWGMAYPLRVAETELVLTRALGWEETAQPSVSVANGVARIPFARGLLIAELATGQAESPAGRSSRST